MGGRARLVEPSCEVDRVVHSSCELVLASRPRRRGSERRRHMRPRRRVILSLPPSLPLFLQPPLRLAPSRLASTYGSTPCSISGRLPAPPHRTSRPPPRPPRSARPRPPPSLRHSSRPPTRSTSASTPRPPSVCARASSTSSCASCGPRRCRSTTTSQSTGASCSPLFSFGGPSLEWDADARSCAPAQNSPRRLHARRLGDVPVRGAPARSRPRPREARARVPGPDAPRARRRHQRRRAGASELPLLSLRASTALLRRSRLAKAALTLSHSSLAAPHAPLPLARLPLAPRSPLAHALRPPLVGCHRRQRLLARAPAHRGRLVGGAAGSRARDALRRCSGGCSGGARRGARRARERRAEARARQGGARAPHGLEGDGALGGGAAPARRAGGREARGSSGHERRRARRDGQDRARGGVARERVPRQVRRPSSRSLLVVENSDVPELCSGSTTDARTLLQVRHDRRRRRLLDQPVRPGRRHVGRRPPRLRRLGRQDDRGRAGGGREAEGAARRG